MPGSAGFISDPALPGIFYRFFRMKKAWAIVSVYFEKKEGDSNGKVFGQKFTGKGAGG
ncbi:MAG: hypothetical protein HFH15_13175 [Ruminococcus sp.]|nr:hypothetical protein [Ruminococcus sp.]